MKTSTSLNTPSRRVRTGLTLRSVDERQHDPNDCARHTASFPRSAASTSFCCATDDIGTKTTRRPAGDTSLEKVPVGYPWSLIGYDQFNHAMLGDVQVNTVRRPGGRVRKDVSQECIDEYLVIIRAPTDTTLRWSNSNGPLPVLILSKGAPIRCAFLHDRREVRGDRPRFANRASHFADYMPDDAFKFVHIPVQALRVYGVIERFDIELERRQWCPQLMR